MSQITMSLEPHVYEVVSDTDKTKTYLVSVNRNHISCTCKSYIYRSHDATGKSTGFLCKHCLGVLEQIKEGST